MHSDRPGVDSRSSQPEFTDSNQSFSTEASTTTYTSPSSSLLPDSNQSERNTSRPADYSGNQAECENDTRKKHQVWENDNDNTNQVKNNNNSYKPTTSMQNGDPMRKVTSGTPTTPSHQQMTTMNAREYAQVVRAWLWQYHQWNSMCAFGMMLPYYAMATFPYYAANNYPSSAGSRPSVNGGAASFTPGAAVNNNNQMGAGGAAAATADGGRANQSQAPQTPQQNFRATEYMIPSLWKRILAELVDFVLLFYIKLMVSVMVMKHMGYIDLEKYDLEYNWFVTMDEFDLSKVFHFTSEVILFELLNRISITIVETMCLRRGIGVVGGATPGKRLLGMKVVSCTDILDLGNGRIQVTPARDIGLYSALLRSILKNFTIAFFFPACLTVFFFDHNRAAYDVLAGSIVVQSVEDAGEL